MTISDLINISYRKPLVSLISWALFHRNFEAKHSSYLISHMLLIVMTTPCILCTMLKPYFYVAFFFKIINSVRYERLNALLCISVSYVLKINNTVFFAPIPANTSFFSSCLKYPKRIEIPYSLAKILHSSLYINNPSR